MQRGEQHGVDGHQHDGRHADGENHLHQRERIFIVRFNFHFIELLSVVASPGWLANVLNFTE